MIDIKVYSHILISLDGNSEMSLKYEYQHRHLKIYYMFLQDKEKLVFYYI